MTDPAGYYDIDKMGVDYILVKTRSGQCSGMNFGYLTLDRSPFDIDLIADKPVARVAGEVALQGLGGNLTPLGIWWTVETVSSRFVQLG